MDIGKEMSLFAEREAQFEAKFAHDATLRFKIRCRRDKLFGLKMAEILGVEDSENYAARYVAADFQTQGDHDVYDLAVREAATHAIELNEDLIRLHLQTCLDAAEQQITSS